MCNKNKDTPKSTYIENPIVETYSIDLMDCVNNCVAVLNKWGGDCGGFITPKGADEWGLEIINDFVEALGCKLTYTIIDDTTGEPIELVEGENNNEG